MAKWQKFRYMYIYAYYISISHIIIIINFMYLYITKQEQLSRYREHVTELTFQHSILVNRVMLSGLDMTFLRWTFGRLTVLPGTDLTLPYSCAFMCSSWPTNLTSGHVMHPSPKIGIGYKYISHEWANDFRLLVWKLIMFWAGLSTYIISSPQLSWPHICIFVFWYVNATRYNSRFP